MSTTQSNENERFEQQCYDHRGRFNLLGFTLVELMVALAVAAVVLTLAVPSFGSVIRGTRLTAASNSLHAALFLTRSEAIKRGRRATLCTSGNGYACEQNIGWHRGWIVFEDKDGNARRDDGEAIVRVGEAQVGGLTITGNTPVRDYVSYAPTGMTRTVGGGLQMGSIIACEGGFARKIVISSTGRPRIVPAERC